MLHLIFGSRCLLCQQRMARELAYLQLCTHCLDSLPWLGGPDATGPSAGPIARQITPLGYEGVAADWVLKAKREAGLVEAHLLGRLLATVLEQAYPAGAQRPELLVPVPLSLRRLLRRGHNQAALIAEPVARRLQIPLARNAVRRKRHTRLQPGLSADDRAANVAGAFRCRARLSGERVAIIDDVTTSGATANAVAASLLAAGATEIHLWCPICAHGADKLNLP